MATRDEIIKGLEFTIEQGKRTTSLYVEGEWEWERACGWTPKQIFSHLAAVAQVVPQLSKGLEDAPETTDIGAGMDMNVMNEQAVSAMASMSPEQVMQAFETNYGNLIEFVKSIPEEQLQAKRSFLSDPVPVSDILANAIMLHGIHHVYEAAARLGAPM
jgi:hypothetical protein